MKITRVLKSWSKRNLLEDLWLGILAKLPVKSLIREAMKNTRVLKSWSKRNLPEDLWPEILAKLPVKSLLRLRSVSKSWQSIIDDPEFARTHLTQFNNNRDETHLFGVQDPFGEEEECVVRSASTFRITARLGSLRSCTMSTDTFGNHVETWFDVVVVGSVDGVFMLQGMDLHCRESELTPELMLWNPSIRKTRMLPPSPQIPGMHIHDWGLGFDPSIGDYKHVRLIGTADRSLHSIAVYTFGTNSWKAIPCPSWRWWYKFKIQRTIYCKGFLCEIAWPSELILFDLSSEVFASILMPPKVSNDLRSDGCERLLTLTDGGCTLALVYFVQCEGFLWVLERFGGDIESMHWTKRHTFFTGISDPERFGILCLKNNGDVFLWKSKAVICYCVETQDEKIVLKKGVEMDRPCTYKESLILLK